MSILDLNGVWTIVDQKTKNEIGTLVVDNQGVNWNGTQVDNFEYEEDKRCLSWGSKNESFRFVREPNLITGNAFINGEVYNDVVGKREL
jgi:hypothetical protein